MLRAKVVPKRWRLLGQDPRIMQRGKVAPGILSGEQRCPVLSKGLPYALFFFFSFFLSSRLFLLLPFLFELEWWPARQWQRMEKLTLSFSTSPASPIPPNRTVPPVDRGQRRHHRRPLLLPQSHQTAPGHLDWRSRVVGRMRRHPGSHLRGGRITMWARRGPGGMASVQSGRV